MQCCVHICITLKVCWKEDDSWEKSHDSCTHTQNQHDVDYHPWKKAEEIILQDTQDKDRVHHQLCAEGRDHQVEVGWAWQEVVYEMNHRSQGEWLWGGDQDPSNSNLSKEDSHRAEHKHSSSCWEETEGGHCLPLYQHRLSGGHLGMVGVLYPVAGVGQITRS